MSTPNPTLFQDVAQTQFAPAPQLPEEVLPHTCAGFHGAFESMTGRKPTAQEVWAAGIRSWRHLNESSFKDLPEKLTAEHIQSLVARVDYTCIDTMVLATVTLTNGHILTGTSRPVSAGTFKLALGQEYALKQAMDKVWELEGYLLRVKRHQAGLV